MVRKSSPTDSATSGITFEVPDEAYPLLHVQRLAGDKFLAPFDGSSPKNTIEFKFWSMHSFRRGARSHVSRKRPECIRKATDLEVKEHG